MTHDEQLAREFTDELYDGYRYLARTIGYRATLFLQMITMHGGVGAAQILLRGPATSDGFARLWEANMLGHSLEAVVVKPRYGSLFTDDELRTARKRLEDHGFDVKHYLHEN